MPDSIEAIIARALLGRTATAGAKAIIAALDAAGFVVVPKEPTKGLLTSMAIRHDHGFFAGYTDDEREAVLRSMRQLHEEVVGTGFYSPEREDDYLAVLAARPKP
jgi:hypothetical protein